MVFGATSQPFARTRPLAGNGEDLASFPPEKTCGNKNYFPSAKTYYISSETNVPEDFYGQHKKDPYFKIRATLGLNFREEGQK